MTEARKVNIAKESFQRPQINSVKASGGAGKPQAKHKNKIPKTLRYDLENALVGLCDVWFEEIKPYLERNNIKLHIHGADSGGGDPEASECSHLDPGRHDRYQHRNANYAGFCSTRPIASRARCPKLPPHPVSSLRLETSMERACPDSAKEQVMPCRRRRKTISQSPTKPLVPRLCHTYKIPPRRTLIESLAPNDIGVLQKPVHSISTCPSPKPKQFKNASTQTGNNVWQKQKVIEILSTRARSQSPSIQKCQLKINVLNAECKKPRPLSPRFGKCQNTTSFFNPKIKNKEQALFQDDLIDIIRDKHDKNLKILFTNPGQDEYPSIMNLFSPKTDLIKSKRPQKVPHWR